VHQYLQSIRTVGLRMLATSPILSRSTRSPNVPLTPSSHGCDCVGGKLRGAFGAARGPGWAKAEARHVLDLSCSNPAGFPLRQRPDMRDH